MPLDLFQGQTSSREGLLYRKIQSKVQAKQRNPSQKCITSQNGQTCLLLSKLLSVKQFIAVYFTMQELSHTLFSCIYAI